MQVVKAGRVFGAGFCILCHRLLPRSVQSSSFMASFKKRGSLPRRSRYLSGGTRGRTLVRSDYKAAFIAAKNEAKLVELRQVLNKRFDIQFFYFFSCPWRFS